MFKKLLAIISLSFFSGVLVAKPVIVVGIGNNFTEARHDAFRQAVEYKINTLILSERKHRNNETLLNQIIVHSSGYVDRYKIVHTRQFDNRIEVKVEVEVSDSKIANRLNSPSDNTMVIDGERHAIQRQTFLEQRETGDKILNAVLTDFPVKAFYVNTPLKPVFSLDDYGNSIITIPYFMGWQYNYLRALHESIDAVYDGPKGYLPNLSRGPRTEIQLRGTMFGNVFTKQQWYTFSNSRRIDMIKNVFDTRRPVLLLTFYDQMNNVLSQKCYDLDKRGGHPFYDFNTHTKVTIQGHDKVNGQIKDYIQFPVEELHKYELTVVPHNICGRGVA
jgi:hypothetical protein